MLGTLWFLVRWGFPSRLASGKHRCQGCCIFVCLARLRHASFHQCKTSAFESRCLARKFFAEISRSVLYGSFRESQTPCPSVELSGRSHEGIPGILGLSFRKSVLDLFYLILHASCAANWQMFWKGDAFELFSRTLGPVSQRSSTNLMPPGLTPGSRIWIFNKQRLWMALQLEIGFGVQTNAETQWGDKCTHCTLAVSTFSTHII